MFSSYRDNCTKKAPSDYLSHPLVLSIIPYFLINIFSSLTGNNKTIPIDRILSYFLLRIIQQSNYDFLLYNMDCLYSTQPTKSAILSFKPPHLYVCLYRLGMAQIKYYASKLAIVVSLCRTGGFRQPGYAVSPHKNIH